MIRLVFSIFVKEVLFITLKLKDKEEEPFIESLYNINYYINIKVASFEALCKSKCRSPLWWDEVGDTQIANKQVPNNTLTSPQIIRETTEKIVQTREWLKASQDRKKILSDETLVIPLDEIEINGSLNFIEEPVEIMDQEVKRTKQSRIPIVKARWNAKRGPEFTRERANQIKKNIKKKKKHPQLFSDIPSTSWISGRNSFNGGRM